MKHHWQQGLDSSHLTPLGLEISPEPTFAAPILGQHFHGPQGQSCPRDEQELRCPTAKTELVSGWCNQLLCLPCQPPFSWKLGVEILVWSLKTYGPQLLILKPFWSEISNQLPVLLQLHHLNLPWRQQPHFLHCWNGLLLLLAQYCMY